MSETTLSKPLPLPKGTKRKKPVRRILILAACILICAGVAGGIIMNRTRRVNAQSETVYREYSVQYGDITIGTEESGTVTVDRNTLTFPLNATIETVLVKVGQSVTEGTPLVQLDIDSVEDVIAEYESKIAEAQKTLNEATYSQGTGVAAAKLQYQSDVTLATSAPVENELSKAQLDRDIATAQAGLTKLKTQLEEYKALQESDDADIAKLEELEKAKDSVEETLATYKEKLSDYTESKADELSSANSTASKYTQAQSSLTSAENEYDYQLILLSTAKAKYDAALAADNASSTAETQAALASAQAALEKQQTAVDSAAQSVNKASYNLSALDSDYDDAGDVIDSIDSYTESLQDSVKYYTDKFEEDTKNYNYYLEYFNDKYPYSGEKLDEQVESLAEQISEAEYNLSKKQKSYASDVASADQKLAGSLSDASFAQEKYNNTLSKLALTVQSAQSSYDSLVKEYDQIKESITGDGILTASCDGVVAAVNYTDGSSYQSGQTIISLADPRYIYMSVAISEEDITSMSVGQAATVSLTAYEGQTFDAVIDTIAYEPARSSSAVTYTVTIKLSDESGALNVYEGMSGDVTILQKQVADTLYVSNQAIAFADGKSTVHLKNDDGTQSTVEVKTGFSDGRYVQILSGLSRGDTVLAESAVSAQ